MKLRLVKMPNGIYQIQKQVDPNLEWKTEMELFLAIEAEKEYSRHLRKLRDAKDQNTNTTVIKEDAV